MASPDKQNQLAVTLYQKAVLYDKAVFNDKAGHNIDGSMNQGNVLYRNQSREYFDGIKSDDGVMKMKKKDNNGDKNNPMNEKEEGIFFMANVKNFTCGKLPDISPYGKRRLSIPIDKLLDNFQTDLEQKYKLFFNDFFCVNTNNNPHYVTIVMCENGSVACNSCEKNLNPLPVNNPFFVLADDGKSFRVSSNTWVEIFYMKDINISEFGDNCYTDVKCDTSDGTVCGKPTSCKICNIP